MSGLTSARWLLLSNNGIFAYAHSSVSCYMLREIKKLQGGSPRRRPLRLAAGGAHHMRAQVHGKSMRFKEPAGVKCMYSSSVVYCIVCPRYEEAGGGS